MLRPIRIYFANMLSPFFFLILNIYTVPSSIRMYDIYETRVYLFEIIKSLLRLLMCVTKLFGSSINQ